MIDLALNDPIGLMCHKITNNRNNIFHLFLFLHQIFVFSHEIIFFSNISLVVVDPKVPFSIDTTPRCRGGWYSFPRIIPLYPYLITLSVKQRCIKYRFLVFGMTRSRIEPRSPGPSSSILPTKTMNRCKHLIADNKIGYFRIQYFS